MQQAVSYDNTILPKKGLCVFHVRWNTAGSIPGSDGFHQKSADRSPERTKGLSQAADRSYLFSLASHPPSYSYQLISNCFLFLHPLFSLNDCVHSGYATSGKVPFLSSPAPEADGIKPPWMYRVFHSDQRT